MTQPELKDYQKQMLAMIEPMIKMYGGGVIPDEQIFVMGGRRHGKSQAARMVANALAGANPTTVIMDELTLISIDEYETHPNFGRF